MLALCHTAPLHILVLTSYQESPGTGASDLASTGQSTQSIHHPNSAPRHNNKNLTLGHVRLLERRSNLRPRSSHGVARRPCQHATSLYDMQHLRPRPAVRRRRSRMAIAPAANLPARNAIPAHPVPPSHPQTQTPPPPPCKTPPPPRADARGAAGSLHGAPPDPSPAGLSATRFGAHQLRPRSHPESVLTGDGSSSSSIVYNAPGCSLAVVPAESAAENGRGGAGSDNHALLRSCRTCGALRVVDAWGACRDFGARRPLDDSGADWEGGRGGWRRREVGYLAGSPGRFLGW
ncbi:hypothetical protein MCOR02_011910 [Pyricularia oryzae]|nr:hypothetical protein MCOR02_011910 [Pyricularia oryzae]